MDIENPLQSSLLSEVSEEAEETAPVWGKDVWTRLKHWPDYQSLLIWAKLWLHPRSY